MSTAKKKIIPIEVRDEYILGSGVSIGARGSYDSAVLRVKFDDSWIGLNKYATWTNANGEDGDQTIITALDLVDGEVDTYDIPVPAFATCVAGTVKISFTGYVIGQGEETVDSLVNTVSGAFRVLDSNATKLDGGNTAASVAEQLVSDMTTLAADMDALEVEMYAFATGLSDAEEQRQINEFGAVGNHWNKDMTAIVDVTGAEVDPKDAGRVGAELLRNQAEKERNAIIGDIDDALDEIISLQNSIIEDGVTVNVPIPVAVANDDGKILSVEGGEYVLKEIGESSVKSYVDEYIESALGGDY